MKYLVTLITAIFITISLNALDLKKVNDLNGTWKFNIGDDIIWAEKEYDDSGWDRITVPGAWEDDGYNGYNGIAWYRKDFSLNNSDHKFYYLVFSNVDDADEVFINGKQVGYLGSFPPEFKTAYNYKRQYVIPAEYLMENNVIAIRVYDDFDRGGIMGDIKICYDYDESYLDLDLSGDWKFHKSHNKSWKEPTYDDSSWGGIFVPSMWEVQGYRFYDGYAWYRKQFNMPKDLTDEELILVLGKIDDVDMIYFNGTLIGTAIKKSDRHLKECDDNNWLMNRYYKIPQKLIKEKNTIAVAVYDKKGHGGIYQGPVGIMTKSNFKDSKIYRQDTYYSFNRFIEDFFRELSE